jgi:hypothetical protein
MSTIPLRTASWQCRKYSKHNTAIIPETNLVGARGYWDGMKTCFHCGCMHFAQVWPDGRIQVTRADGRNNNKKSITEFL